MIRRICLYGGPGTGKSTVASKLFAELKAKHHNVEYISEYIKSWAYEGRKPYSFQQLYVFGKQMNREDVVLPHVDFIISDSPLLMQVFYCQQYGFKGWKEILNLANLFEDQFPALHLFLDRDGIPYQDKGRYQNYEEALEMDRRIEDGLKLYCPNYIKVKSSNFSEILRAVEAHVAPRRLNFEWDFLYYLKQLWQKLMYP